MFDWLANTLLVSNFVSSLRGHLVRRRKLLNWTVLLRNCTSNRMVSGTVNDKFSSLSYHESNLSLIKREIMRLLVNHQVIRLRYNRKASLLNKSFLKDLKVLL